MKTTLGDIAKVVGVSKPTISVVLNNSKSGIRVSERTREKIKKVAKELNYFSNGAARALATNRSGFIGFLLSDAVTDGLGNPYFAQNIASVEEECRRQGYGLSISKCSLSNIKDFAFPEKVGQRSVDGLVLAGHVAASVLEEFRKFGIPCVCIGENLDAPEDIPVVTWDMVGGIKHAIDYAMNLQHRRVAVAFPKLPWYDAIVSDLRQQFRQQIQAEELELMEMTLPDDRCDYTSGIELFARWRNMSEDQRPTTIITSDQACLAALSEMEDAGFHCPEDLSLISSCDSRLCEFAKPKLTAVWRDMQSLGRIAASVLLDHLEQKTSVSERNPIDRLPCKLITRCSCKSQKT